MIRRRKGGGRANDAELCIQAQLCRCGARVVERQVALTVDILDTKARIDGGLIGVGRRT